MVWRLLPLLAIAWMGCHDNPRENPFDFVSTPAVEIHTVVVDSLQGTAALTWSQYAGGQPFGEYRVVRRLIGQIEAEVRGTISTVGDTTFVDTELQADRTYSYEIVVVNKGGGVATSAAFEATSGFVAPQIRNLEFESITATARLAWAGRKADSASIAYFDRGKTTPDQRSFTEPPISMKPHSSIRV